MRSQSKVEGGEEAKPLRYVDFIGPNPLARPWVLPYLPSNVYMRDGIIGLAGLALGGLLAVGLMLLPGDFGVIPGLAIFVVTLWIFPGEVQGRYLGASVKYWQERNRIRRSRSS